MQSLSGSRYGRISGPPNGRYESFSIVAGGPWWTRAASLCFGLVLGVWTGAAQAQQETVAESLFREARETLKRGEPELACPRFAESYRLDPSLGTLLNWGVCEQQRGHVATAWTKLRQFSDTAPAGDPRLNLARRKIAELEPELPKLRVVVSEGEGTATVFLDGVELRSASLGVDLPVDPGEHSVGIKLRTGESGERQVRLGLAEQLEVKLSWPVPPAADAPEPGDAPQQPQRPMPTINRPLAEIDVRRAVSSTRTERRWAYGVGTVGAVGLITGGVFGLLAVHERSVVRALCPEHQCRDGRGLDAVHSGARDEAIANVTVAVGTLAVGAAALLWLHSSSSAVAVHAGNNSLSVDLRREFQ